jgi:CTP-dependent riboflavin kinase
MADETVLRAIEELAGVSLVPGTLNMLLDETFDRPEDTFYVAACCFADDWADKTGQAGYFLTPVLIEGQYRAFAMQPEEAGYPPEQVELIGEARLRDKLGLGDDSQLRFTAPPH